MILKGYDDPVLDHKYDDLGEGEQVLEIHKLPTQAEEEIGTETFP